MLNEINKCFNPYFNGYSTLTAESLSRYNLSQLGFNPYFNGYSTLTPEEMMEVIKMQKEVSILILMDTLL